MKKLLLAALCFLAIGALEAGKCKNCGCDTYKIDVYQCKKCRTFFCDRCYNRKEKQKSDNKKKKTLGDLYVEALLDLTDAYENGIDILCPGCSTEGKLYMDGNGNFSSISSDFKLIKIAEK